MSDSRLLIISHRCGRLANRIILFANFAALAEERGWCVSNPTFHSYAHLFPTTAKDIYCRYPLPARRSVLDALPGVSPLLRKTRLLTNAAKYTDRRPGVFGAITVKAIPGEPVVYLEQEEFLRRIGNAKKVFIHGWKFRSPALVRKHGARVREFFKPNADITSAAEKALQPLRAQCDIVIGVHIRQTDYRTWHDGKYFFEVGRYAAWMRDMVAQFPGKRVGFFVCSDEPRRADEFSGLTVAFGGSPLADNSSLSLCDYVVGPISTFSQWASFYGNKPLFHLTSADAAPVLQTAKVSDLDFIA